MISRKLRVKQIFVLWVIPELGHSPIICCYRIWAFQDNFKASSNLYQQHISDPSGPLRIFLPESEIFQFGKDGIVTSSTIFIARNLGTEKTNQQEANFLAFVDAFFCHIPSGDKIRAEKVRGWNKSVVWKNFGSRKKEGECFLGTR